MLAHVLFALTCLLWGSSFILMKKAAGAFGPVGIGAYRVLSGAAALGLLWAAGRRRWPLTRAEAPGVLLVATVAYALPFVIQPVVIGRTGSAFMGMMIGLVPLLTIAVSAPMLGVWPTRRQLAGVLLGLAFVGVLLGDAHRRRASPGTLALAAAVPLGYAVANTYIKRRFSGVPVMALTCATLTTAGAMLLPLTLAAETIDTGPRFSRALAALLVLGLPCTGLGYYFFYGLVQRRGPLYAGMVTYVIPAIALVWGWGDGERITAGQVAALVGILASVALVQGRMGAAEKAQS